MATKTPMTESLALLRKEGYHVEIVEKWNHFAKCKQDLFGILDIVALGTAETLGVQTTSRDHISHRRVKILASPILPKLREAGWRILIHGWDKDSNGAWRVKIEEI